MNAAIDLEPLRTGIEDYLPLLVIFFIWWISSRMAGKKQSNREGQGQARTSRQSGPSEAPSSEEEVSPLDVLRQMLFGEMEMPTIPPLQPQPPEAPFPADLGDAYQAVAEWQGRPPLSPAPAERVVPTASSRQEVRQPPVRVSSPATAQPKQKRMPMILARTPRRELKRAVVWSEVLAPPVGLRDASR